MSKKGGQAGGLTGQQRGGAARAFTILLVMLAVLGLSGVVAYLMADINHRRFRLAVKEGTLRVERGLHLPMGFAAYEPETPGLKDAYAPVVIPTGENVGTLEVFDERADIDRVLFMLLSKWANDRIATRDGAAQELAVSYVKRLEILPSLSEDQRGEMQRLRAGVAYKNGLRLVDESAQLLRRANHEFRTAVMLGGADASQAQRMIGEVDKRLDILGTLTPPPPTASGSVPNRPKD